MEQRKARLGVLALMLKEYEGIFPGITKRQQDFLTAVLAQNSDLTDFDFPRISLCREDTQQLTEEFQRKDLDGLLVFLLSYAPGQYLIRAMQHNHLPLAMLLIQPDQSAGADFGELELTVNQAIHGTQDNANCLLRAQIPCVYFVGNREEDGLRRFLSDFAAAAMARRTLQNLKVGVIGKLTGMGDVISDDMAVFEKLGPEFIYDSIGTVTRCVEAVPEADVQRALKEDETLFTIDPKLSPLVHADAVRQYLGIKAYLEQGGYGAYTIHFDEFGADGRYQRLPFLAASRLMADGYGYAAEGDASCAAWMAAMRTLCGAADFSEMYLMDFARNALLLCHAGEGNIAVARKDRKPFLMDRVFGEGGLANPPTPIFTPEPGEAIVMSLVHLGGTRFRLVAAHGAVLDECGLAACDMPYLFFRPDCGVAPMVRRWLENGGTHHETIVFGDHMEKLRLLCRLLGVELAEL